MPISAPPRSSVVTSGPVATQPAPGFRKSIVSPGVDALCAGGLSLLVLVPLLVTGRGDLLIFSAGVQAWVGALVNMPHFLASYRMVYRTRESIRAHPWAAIYVPALLLSYCIAAIVMSQWTAVPVSALLTLSSSYLAWHYTGQAWGMIATFTHLGGTSLASRERWLVRGSLVIMMAWHVVWFLHLGYRDLVDLTPVYYGISVLAAVALTMGLAGFTLHRKRTGHWAPLRAWIPWVSIFVWYGLMAKVGLPALFIVQIAHAVQYLIFPFRVEVNRSRRKVPPGATQLVALRFGLYLVAILAGSLVAAIALPLGAMAVVTDWIGSRSGMYAGFLISSFFNIHHYFTDGVVWKLRNPEVREDLFGHLQPPVAAPVRGVPKHRVKKMR